MQIRRCSVGTAMELLKMKSVMMLIVILALFEGVFGDVKTEGTSKVLFHTASDIGSALPSNESSVVTFTIGSDIPSNLAFSITSDIASNVTPDGSPNVTSHVTSNISLAIASDMPSRATFTMTSDVPSNVTMNITSDVPFNVTSNVPFSDPMAATSELPSSETFEALAVKSTETSSSTKDNSNAILKMLFDGPFNITSFIHIHPKPSLPSNAASDRPVSVISSSPSSLASDTLSTETATVMSETSTTTMLDGSLEAFDVTSTETPVTQYDSNRILNVTSDGSNFTPSIFFDLPSTTPSNAASDGPVDITTSLPFDLASDILSTETPAMSETPSTTMLDASVEVLDVTSTETSFTQENSSDVTDGPVNPTSSLPFNPASSIPASTASYGLVTSTTSSPFSVPADGLADETVMIMSEPESNTMSNEILEDVDVKYETLSPPQNTNTTWEPRIAAIHGGRQAYQGQFPFMVAIHSVISMDKFGGSRFGTCGGTIISSRWVLTAAHCVDKNPIMILLVFGDIDKGNVMGTWYTGPGVSMYASGMSIHPLYHDFWKPYNDIALISTPKDIPFGIGIQPVKLASIDHHNANHGFARAIGTIVGWGRSSPRNTKMRFLQWSRVPILSNAQCSAYWSYINNNEICIKPFDEAEVCEGDSGGPLLVLTRSGHEYVQVGIVSYSGVSCPSYGGGVFTRITSFLQWIAHVIQKLENH